MSNDKDEIERRFGRIWLENGSIRYPCVMGSGRRCKIPSR